MHARRMAPGYTAVELNNRIAVVAGRILRILVILLVALGAAWGLLACGQKGPLYFPEEEEQEEREKKDVEQQSLLSSLRQIA